MYFLQYFLVGARIIIFHKGQCSLLPSPFLYGIRCWMEYIVLLLCLLVINLYSFKDFKLHTKQPCIKETGGICTNVSVKSLNLCCNHEEELSNGGSLSFKVLHAYWWKDWSLAGTWLCSETVHVKYYCWLDTLDWETSVWKLLNPCISFNLLRSILF